MSDMDTGQSDVELLQEAIAADAPAPQESATPQPPQVTPDQPAAPEADENPDLFADANIDLSNLTQAEELRIRQMQAHFTRKTQALSEAQKAFGDVDPEAAREAMNFVSQLQNDPNYALQVHTELTQALMQAGLTPQQAAAQASQQINDASASDDMEEWGWEDPEPEYRVPPEVQQQLNELQSWKQDQEQNQLRSHYEAELQRQEMAIRQNNPTYTNDDMETIYGLAFAYDGDLVRASDAFASERNRIIAGYLQEKSQVPQGTPQSAGPAETPQTLTFEEAHKAAMEDVRRMQAEGLL